MKYPECNECKCHSCMHSLCARGQCNICKRLHNESSPPVNYNVTLVCKQHLSFDDAMCGKNATGGRA